MFRSTTGALLATLGPLLGSSSAQVTFTDVAASSGIVETAFGRSAAMSDLDGDGLMDLIAINAGMSNHYYRQISPGSFVENSAGWGLIPDTRQHWAAVVADFDNDGDDDVYVATGGFTATEPNQLLRNDINTLGVFTDVSSLSGDGNNSSNNFGVTTADYDNDGDLDVFVTTTNSSQACVLLSNEGSGVFLDVSAGAGITELGMFMHCNSGDFDDDGWVDIGAGNLQGSNVLYKNQANGSFQNVATAMGIASPLDNFNVQLEDFDNDGLLDVFIPKYNVPVPATHKTEVYLNDGVSSFTDVSAGMGLTAQTDMGHNTGDLDGDGFPDIYIGTGSPAIKYLDLLLLVTPDGQGGLATKDVSATSGVQSNGPTRCHGMAIGDYNGDGALDIFVNNGGPSADASTADPHSLFRAQPNGSTWAGFELEGVRSNRSGIGAHLIATTSAGREVHRRRRAGTGFGNNNSPVQHVAIGSDASITRLEIHWPSGIVQTLLDPAMFLVHQVVETGLQLNGPTQIGGQVQLDLAGPSGQTVELFFALQSTQLGIPGLGELVLLPPLVPLGPGTLDAQGKGSASLPIPSDPALAGAVIYLQGWFHDPISFSNGLLSNGIPVQLQ